MNYKIMLSDMEMETVRMNFEWDGGWIYKKSELYVTDFSIIYFTFDGKSVTKLDISEIKKISGLTSNDLDKDGYTILIGHNDLAMHFSKNEKEMFENVYSKLCAVIWDVRY